jgi:hypothetical protein
MRLFPIRCLIFLSTILPDLSCSQYRHMQKIQSDKDCVQKFKPDFHFTEYKTSVDVIGKHISGLLIIKEMTDSSTRIVFTNEMGFTFFDFGFISNNGFVIYQIFPQMNKPAVVNTLRKDFELLLFRNMDNNTSYSLSDSGYIYHAYPQKRGVNYYVTDNLCTKLVKMQRASNRKAKVEAFMDQNLPANSPDSISIRHLNFNFSISLKKIRLLAP